MGMSNSPTQRNAALEVSKYYYMIFGAARRSEKQQTKIGAVDP